MRPTINKYTAYLPDGSKQKGKLTSRKNPININLMQDRSTHWVQNANQDFFNPTTLIQWANPENGIYYVQSTVIHLLENEQTEHLAFTGQ